MSIPSSSASRSIGRAAAMPLRVAPWIVVGVLAGSFPILAAGAGVPTRYILYGSLGAALLGVVPYLATAAGSLNRLLWVAFILSLQLELAWAPMSWSYAKLAGPYGLLISPTLIVGVALLLVWTAAETWGHAVRVPGPGLALYLAAAAMIAAALLSMTETPDRSLSAYGIFELLSLIVTAAVGAYGCGTPAGVRLFRGALLVILAVQSVAIIAEQVLGVQFSLAHGVNAAYDWASGPQGRFAGTFGAPSVGGTFVATCLLFAFARLFSRRPPARPLLLGLLFGIGFCALLLTRTRSAWIGFAIGSVGLGWRALRNGTISRRTVAWLVVAGLVAMLAAWPLVRERLMENHEEAAEVRGKLVRIAAVMIAAHPLTGIGLNTATSQVYRYAAEAGVEGWVFIVHNQFLLVAAETGIPGLLALVAVIAIGLRAAQRATRAADVLVSETAAVLFWSLLALVWALNLDHVSGCKTYFLLWFLVGAACGLRNLARRPAADDPQAR